MIKIAPSILSANFASLGQELENLEKAGADFIHIDVMDGHFVPNLTFGPQVIKSLRNYTKLPFDVHLMIDQPENSIESYITAGADYITIHPETTKHLDRTINLIKNPGAKAGIALLPTTGAEILRFIIDKLDLILIMTVNPGFGGQEFMSNQLPKIKEVANLIGNRNILLSVDGGINDQTAKFCRENGAKMLVSGNYIFSGDYQKRIITLKNS